MNQGGDGVDIATQNYLRFLDGEEEAFDEVLKELFLGLVFFVDRFVHDTNAAEDIAMDTFAELLARPGKYKFSVSVKTYLYMLARSRALNYLKHRKIITFIEPSQIGEVADEGASLEESVLADERRREINEAIAELQEDMQTAVHLVYFEEMSYADAAQVMKKTRKQVDNLLYRAKNELREILGKERELL